MDPIDAQAKNKYTYAEWLNYYKNVWNRNLVARTIDVQTDLLLKSQDPEMVVQHEGGSLPVKERLEHRKILVQDALDLIAGIDLLIAQTPEEYVKNNLTKEALAVAPDMLPPAAKAGDVCMLGDKAGTLEEVDGKLICVVPTEEKPAATDTVSPTPPGVEEKKGGDAPSAEAQV